MTPIFIFSLPRSGSTLLQRLLMAHEEISSMAEPWVLLPFMFANKPEGLVSVYSQRSAYFALQDVINNLPQKELDYNNELGKFIKNLYSKLSENEKTAYFLDKTPRYYHIIDEINKIFPDAKFIFLFRNPLDVISSILNTWLNNDLRGLNSYYTDLMLGPTLLSKGCHKYHNKAITINYEELVESPKEVLQNLTEYLEIPWSENLITDFSNQDLKGKKGDPKRNHKSTVKSTTSSWKFIISSYLKKKHILSILKSIDDEYYMLAGYSKIDILNKLRQHKVPIGNIFKDFKHLSYNWLARKLMLKLFINDDYKIYKKLPLS